MAHAFVNPIWDCQHFFARLIMPMLELAVHFCSPISTISRASHVKWVQSTIVINYWVICADIRGIFHHNMITLL